MKLKELLDKLDTNVDICIKCISQDRYLNHEYNIEGDDSFFHEVIYTSRQSYYSSILDILNEHACSEVKHIHMNYTSPFYLVIEINEFPDPDFDIV